MTVVGFFFLGGGVRDVEPELYVHGSPACDTSFFAFAFPVGCVFMTYDLFG